MTMDKCKVCGSYAVNDHLYGRKKRIDLDLCDVCYWRKRYKLVSSKNDKLKDIINTLRNTPL